MSQLSAINLLSVALRGLASRADARRIAAHHPQRDALLAALDDAASDEAGLASLLAADARTTLSGLAGAGSAPPTAEFGEVEYFLTRRAAAALERRRAMVHDLPALWRRLVRMSSAVLREALQRLGTQMAAHAAATLPATEVVARLTPLGAAAARSVVLLLPLARRNADDAGLRPLWQDCLARCTAIEPSNALLLLAEDMLRALAMPLPRTARAALMEHGSRTLANTLRGLPRTEPCPEKLHAAAMTWTERALSSTTAVRAESAEPGAQS